MIEQISCRLHTPQRFLPRFSTFDVADAIKQESLLCVELQSYRWLRKKLSGQWIYGDWRNMVLLSDLQRS